MNCLGAPRSSNPDDPARVSVHVQQDFAGRMMPAGGGLATGSAIAVCDHENDEVCATPWS